jgi:hypothetical protein
MTDPKYASVDDLVQPEKVETKDVTLSTGKVVKVRGMTRMEMILSRKSTEDPAVIEQRMIEFCQLMPRMKAAQVEKWQRASGPMVMAPVTEAIRELSGLLEGADKSDSGSAGE